MRGYRVAPIAKYKGDKAKKEFAVDNSIELNRLRDKYAEQLTTEDEKKILPLFFAHVARQKGYYDPQHKAYIAHDTSMDYLQTIVRKFKTKNKLQKPTSKLIDLFDLSKYDNRRVNHKQISHIMKYVQWYSTQVAKLFDHTSDHACQTNDEIVNGERLSKFDQYSSLQNELIEHIGNYKIGYSTMIFMLKQFEKKEYYKHRNVLLPLLFTACRESFLDAVIKSQDGIDVLVEKGKDLFLFDFGFKIKQNTQFLTKKAPKCHPTK